MLKLPTHSGFHDLFLKYISNLATLIVPVEGYSRNVSCALNYLCRFLSLISYININEEGYFMYVSFETPTQVVILLQIGLI